MRNVSKSGIVAYYMYNKKDQNIIGLLNKQEKKEKYLQEGDLRNTNSTGNMNRYNGIVDDIHVFVDA